MPEDLKLDSIHAQDIAARGGSTSQPEEPARKPRRISRNLSAARSLALTPVEHVRVGGLKVTTLSCTQLIDLMLSEAPRLRQHSTPACRLLFSSNGHSLSLRARDLDYRQAVDAGDIVHADGGSIVAASRFLAGKPIADRSATTDLFLESLKAAAERRVGYYLLGGREEVNAACAAELVTRHPGLQIAGRHHGYFNSAEEDAIIDDINRSGADVLWVGLGKPLEQTFCIRNKHRLKVGWAVTCGGLFNFVTGDYPRAPLWMRKRGLEWLHRLATNPRHLFWRYATTNPHALWLMLRHRSRAIEQA